MSTDLPLVRFSSRETLVSGAADWLSEQIEAAISARGEAALMLAGGSTPEPIYSKLSGRVLDWSVVKIGLTDERWVEADHPRSNAAMIKRSLLKGAAANAIFLPMKTSDETPQAGLVSLNQLYQTALAADTIVLGMGNDAHTLSWFPGAEGLVEAINPENPLPVAAIQAIPSGMTGAETARVTLTYSVIAQARQVVLIITGPDKLNTLLKAGPDDPVSHMRQAAGDRLVVFYAE